MNNKRAALFTKLGLAVCFLLGLLFVFLGIWGSRTSSDAGFSSGDSSKAISDLSEDVSSAWNSFLSSDRGALTDDGRTAADDALLPLVKDSWESRKEGGGEEAGTFIDEGGANRAERLYKLMYLSGLMSGPKVPSSVKKAVAAIPEANRPAFRQQLLRCIPDEHQAVPDEAAEAVEGLTGSDRQSMLFQLIIQDISGSDASVSDHVKALKKSVRDKAGQLEAFKIIASGGASSGLSQFIISNSKTVILVGIALMLDIVILALLMMADRRWALNIKWIIILLIVDFLLIFQVLPVMYMVVKGFFPDGAFSLETFKRLLSYSLNRQALKNTLIAGFSTMILGTLIAFPLAWLVGRTNLYGKKFFRAVFVMTYMVPPYVGAMAWLRLLNPNVGTINKLLRVIFCLGDSSGPLNIYTLGGIIWVLTSFYYPYAFITISRAMEKMDPSLEEAGRVSGASPLKTLLTVTLPMMTPSLIAGALLVFIAAASCYGIPSIIGTSGNVYTVTTRIVEYVNTGQSSMNDAIGLALFLMGVALVILFISDGVLAKKQYITVSGKSVQPAIVDLRSWRIPLTVLVTLFAVIMVGVPFATILSTSFKIDVGKSVFASNNFTTVNWTTVFSSSETMTCLKNSLIFATVAATVGLIIACVMSYLLQRTQIRGRSIPNFLITLGSGTPSVVIALGLIMTMRGNFGINIYNTAWILIIAYLIKYLMMGMRTVVSAMSQIHVSLEESSQISGAGWLRTMLKITGPLIFPSIAAGWFLIFIPSFYELSMTTLLYSASTKTLGYELYEYWTFTSQPMACAMAFGILLFVVLLNFLLNRLTKGEFSI
jgi:iron(III) transport system permease protein